DDGEAARHVTAPKRMIPMTLSSDDTVLDLKRAAAEARAALESQSPLVRYLDGLEQRAAQRTAELAIINSVQSALAAEQNIQGIYEAVGDKIREIFDAQSVAIGSYDHVNGLVDYRYVVQKEHRVAMQPAPFAGMSKYMLNHRQTLLLEENTRQRLQE